MHPAAASQIGAGYLWQLLLRLVCAAHRCCSSGVGGLLVWLLLLIQEWHPCVAAALQTLDGQLMQLLLLVQE